MNALLLMMHCEKKGYKLPVFCTFDRVAGLNYTKDKQGVRQQIKDNNGQELPKVSILKGERVSRCSSRHSLLSIKRQKRKLNTMSINS